MSASDRRIDLRTLYIGQIGRCFACSRIMAPLPYGLSQPDGWIRSYFHRATMAARWWYWPKHRATTMVRSEL